MITYMHPYVLKAKAAKLSPIITISSKNHLNLVKSYYNGSMHTVCHSNIQKKALKHVQAIISLTSVVCITMQHIMVAKLDQDTQQCVMQPKKPACHTREYIDRKNNNAIFMHTLLCAGCTKPSNFCCGDALHCQYHTFQISTKSCQSFEISKIGLVSSLFSRYESYHKVKWVI